MNICINPCSQSLREYCDVGSQYRPGDSLLTSEGVLGGSDCSFQLKGKVICRGGTPTFRSFHQTCQITKALGRVDPETLSEPQDDSPRVGHM